MQNDLISRSALIAHIKEFTDINTGYFENPELLVRVIKNQPTAYDVEKVVAELNDYYEEKLVIVTPQARERVEDIVRNGGKE